MPVGNSGKSAYPHHILHNYQAGTASAWPWPGNMVSRRTLFDRHNGPPATPLSGCGGGDISLMSSSPLSAKTTSAPDSFFTATLTEADPDIAAAISGELGRQRHEIELIASENIVSRAVLEAQGSVMTNKYAEGYPGARYYGGCEWVDVAETLAIERAKKLFGANFANVQAELRQPDESGRVPGAAAARRYLHGAGSRRRRTPDPRLAGQHVRQMVQGLALHRAPRRPSHRYGCGRQAGGSR